MPARGQVRVGDMQEAQRRGAGGQHGDVVAAQGEPVALDDGGVAEAGAARRGRSAPSQRLGRMPFMVPCGPD